MQYIQMHGVSLSARRYVPPTNRSPKDPFLTKKCPHGRYPVTLDPKGMATVRYEPAKAGCIRMFAVKSWPCSSQLAHRVFLLHVKSRVASCRKRVSLLSPLLCCLEQQWHPQCVPAWCGFIRQRVGGWCYFLDSNPPSLVKWIVLHDQLADIVVYVLWWQHIVWATPQESRDLMSCLGM